MKFGRKTIHVSPETVLHNRRGLFEACKKIFPVQFVSSLSAGMNECDGALVFKWSQKSLEISAPTLFLLPPRSDSSARAKRVVRLANSGYLDSSLRGKNLEEQECPSFVSPNVDCSGTVLATLDDEPVWIRGECEGGEFYVASFEPVEIEPGYGLKSYLREGRFVGLLPLVHFLEATAKDLMFVEPPLRANFVIDDPNIRFPKYGFIDFAELIKHANMHDYAVTVATIPLDLNWVSAPSMKLFRGIDERVSFAIHGNNHTHFELDDKRTSGVELNNIAQALRRVEHFENRYGISIGRVVVPPHNRCSRQMLRALSRMGIFAVHSNRPDTWSPHENQKRTGFEDPDTLEWYAADFVEGGTAVIPRRSNLYELVLRAYLRRPIVEVFHHDSFKTGLDILEEFAARIRSLGKVSWMPLERIATTNYASRVEGGKLLIRLYSGYVEFVIPWGIYEMEIHLPHVHEVLNIQAAIVNGQSYPPNVTGYTVTFGPFACKENEIARISLMAKDAVPFNTVEDPDRAIQPVVRRALTEARDRLQPLLFK